MGDTNATLFGGFLLIVGLAGGYWRWLRPRQATLDVQGQGLVALLVLTLVGGFIGAPFWWLDDVRSFAWDLPPLASRMLASASWSFVVGTFLALERPSFQRVRLVLLLLAVYLGPLIIAIVLFHLNRFNWTALITYSFFVIAGGMTIASVWYLLRQPAILPDTAQDRAPASPLIQTWLGLVTILTGLWGVALFLTDNGPSNLIWVWPGDLLTSRLIGVMLLAIAVGAFYSRTRADLSRLMLAVTLTYGLGLAAASAWNALAGLPVRMSYLVVFGVVFLVSSALLALARPRLRPVNAA